MLAPMKTQYDKSGPTLVKAMKKRQFDAYYCSTAEEAVEKVLELIPEGDVVSWGGVATVDQLGIKDRLRQRNQPLIDRDTAKTPDERMDMLRQALTCGTFLMSSNAISEDGEYRRHGQPRGRPVLRPQAGDRSSRYEQGGRRS